MKELLEQKKQLQEELEKNERMKKVAMITDNQEELDEANSKIEEIGLLIEEINTKISEIEAKVRAAQEELTNLLGDKLNTEDKLKELKNQYIEYGYENLIAEIESINNHRVELNNREQELQGIINSFNDAEVSLDEENAEVQSEEENVDITYDEPEEIENTMVYDDSKENDMRVQDFINLEAEAGKSYNEIAEELNEMVPTALDEYVESKNFQIFRSLWSLIVPDSFSLSLEQLSNFAEIPISNDIPDNFKEVISKMNELITSEETKNIIANKDYDNSRFSIINEKFRDLEEKCIDMIFLQMRGKFIELADEGLVEPLTRDECDSTHFYDDVGYQNSHIFALSTMYNNIYKKYNVNTLPKYGLEQVGKLGEISAEDVASYIANENNKSNEDDTEELMAMFNEPSVDNISEAAYKM